MHCVVSVLLSIRWEQQPKQCKGQWIFRQSLHEEAHFGWFACNSFTSIVISFVFRSRTVDSLPINLKKECVQEKITCNWQSKTVSFAHISKTLSTLHHLPPPPSNPLSWLHTLTNLCHAGQDGPCVRPLRCPWLTHSASSGTYILSSRPFIFKPHLIHSVHSQQRQ